MITLSNWTLVAYGCVIALISIPRVLVHAGLQNEFLLMLVTPWATFAIVLMTELIVLRRYLKNKKMAIFMVIMALLGAFIITFYVLS